MLKQYFRKRSIRFRQFSNRAYAAFLSVHREVTIGKVAASIADMELLKQGRHVAVVALCVLVSGYSYAAGNEGESGGVPLTDHQQLSLPQVLVVAHKAEVQSEAFRLVSTLSRDEIAALPIQTVADILAYLPGLDVRPRGANGSQVDASMRGGTFEQVLIMLNGVPLNDAHTGHYSLNLPIPTRLIERVEVMEGGAAGIYGAYSLSGAVNIVTKRTIGTGLHDAASGNPKSAEGELALTAGMNGLVNGQAVFSYNGEEAQVTAAGEYLRSEGYKAPAPTEKEVTALRNSDLHLADIYLQTSYKGLDVQLGSQYKDAGAGMFYGFGSQDQFDATRTAFGSLRYKNQWGRWSADAQASYRANYDRYEWHRGQRQYGNFHLSQNAAASVKVAFAESIGRTSVGVEVRNENIHSTNLGDTVNPAGQVPNVTGFDLKDLNVFDLVKGKNRLNVNYFVEQDFFRNNWSASLTFSGNWNTMFGNNFTGGINLGWQYAPMSSVYVNANRSLRMPSFTDLYYDAGNQLGNRNLKPENAWTFSVGTKYSKSGFSLSADVYCRLGRNIIDWVYVPEDSKRPYHAQNQRRVNAYGAELKAAYSYNKWLRRISAAYSYTYLDLNLHESGSRYLDYLSHKLVLQIEHAVCFFPSDYGYIGMSESLRFQKREGEFNDVEGNVQSYRPVWLPDIALFYHHRQFKVSAECTNLINMRYYDSGGILQPGAWAKITIEVRL